MLLARILAGDDGQSHAPGIELIEEIEEFQRHNRQTRAWDVCVRWTIAATLTLLALLLVIYLAKRPSEGTEKSIAVLPFRNLSHDSANAFFAEGVQDDIVSRLIKIRDLKVVSRLGAAQYAADKPRDLRDIGHALGVRHLLEGSLRREGDRVRLHVSLVDSRDSHEVWSEGYDRTLADAINLQGELAADIADALDATLSPNEKVEVRAQTTYSADAYILYLQGRELESNPAFAISAYEGAEALYRHAVNLDRHFALAHARLSITLGLLYRFRGSSEELRASAREEAKKALELNSHLGEAHLALGLYYYRVERDYPRALPELEMARKLLPSDTEAEVTIAYVHRRQGRWRDARREQEAVRLRDPVYHEFERELDATACLLRDWPSATTHAARAVMLAPKMGLLQGEQALVPFWWKGDLNPLRTFSDGVKGYGDPEGMAAWTRWDTAMLYRDFVGAQRAVDEFPLQTLPSVWGAPVPKSYLEGCIFLAQGKAFKATEMFEVARPAMEAELISHPADSLRHARLGLLYAYLSRKNDAIREANRAAELAPIAKDAIDCHQRLCNLALVYGRVGEATRAISLIQTLLREPGCVSPLNEASLSLWDLRVRWQWDPLRSDARFRQILAGPEPTTVY